MFNPTDWGRLSDQDVSWCVRRLPRLVRDAMMVDSRIACAGGFVRDCIARDPISDVDLFTASKSAAEALAYDLAGVRNLAGKPFVPEKGRPERKAVYASQYAYTVKAVNHGFPVQIIHRWTFDRPEFVVPSFDFTIARAAIWYDVDAKGWRSLCAPSFYADLAAKRLVYCSPVRNEDAGGSMLRLLKFYQRGYRCPLDSLGAVISRLVSGIRPEECPARGGDSEELWRAKILTGLLFEVDPNTALHLAPYEIAASEPIDPPEAE